MMEVYIPGLVGDHKDVQLFAFKCTWKFVSNWRYKLAKWILGSDIPPKHKEVSFWIKSGKRGKWQHKCHEYTLQYVLTKEYTND